MVAAGLFLLCTPMRCANYATAVLFLDPSVFNLEVSPIDFFKVGKLRPLAVTSTKRLDALPGGD